MRVVVTTDTCNSETARADAVEQRDRRVRRRPVVIAREGDISAGLATLSSREIDSSPRQRRAPLACVEYRVRADDDDIAVDDRTPGLGIRSSRLLIAGDALAGRISQDDRAV